MSEVYRCWICGHEHRRHPQGEYVACQRHWAAVASEFVAKKPGLIAEPAKEKR